ncbi:MAG: sigma-70 family RNA polymerase sigma factor [Acidobacteriales bacterium]|nr:sigma-70 family RNA polymerase sigma factor [Terriglobales bacterium]
MSSEAALTLPKVVANSAVPRDELSSHRDQDLQAASDEQLLHAVASGSREAATILFRRHGRSIWGIAWRVLRDDGEAADLRQDIFLHIFERAKLYDSGKGSVISWLIQMTYHRAIDRRRFLSRRHHYRIEELQEGQRQTRSPESLTDVVDGRSILNDLHRHLTEDQRRTLEQHLFEGYTFREIAEKNGQSVGNIRHHYYRAIERLRARLLSRKKC